MDMNYRYDVVTTAYVRDTHRRAEQYTPIRSRFVNLRSAIQLLYPPNCMSQYRSYLSWHTTIREVMTERVVASSWQ